MTTSAVAGWLASLAVDSLLAGVALVERLASGRNRGGLCRWPVDLVAEWSK